MERRRHLTAGRVTTYVTLVVLAILFLMPVYVMLVTSLKPLSQTTLAQMWQFPQTLTLKPFLTAYHKLLPNLLNSIYLVVPAAIISTFLGSLNGYVLEKWRFKGSDVVFGLLLFGMFIPYQAILLPLISFLQKIHLYNTIPGLILTHVVYGIPITTLIFRNFYSNIPDEIMEFAKIDGAGFLSIYRHIILPLSVMGFVVAGIWQFTNIWNEFLWAITITTSPDKQPVMVALQNLAGSRVQQFNLQMAGALLAALPTLLVYVLLGKYFVRGLLAGSVKG